MPRARPVMSPTVKKASAINWASRRMAGSTPPTGELPLCSVTPTPFDGTAAPGRGLPSAKISLSFALIPHTRFGPGRGRHSRTSIEIPTRCAMLLFPYHVHFGYQTELRLSDRDRSRSDRNRKPQTPVRARAKSQARDFGICTITPSGPFGRRSKNNEQVDELSRFVRRRPTLNDSPKDWRIKRCVLQGDRVTNGGNALHFNILQHAKIV